MDKVTITKQLKAKKIKLPPEKRLPRIRSAVFLTKKDKLNQNSGRTPRDQR